VGCTADFVSEILPDRALSPPGGSARAAHRQLPQAAARERRCYRPPFVLEGRGFSVDGGGTLIATEQFLLNPNHNPDRSREQIERGLYESNCALLEDNLKRLREAADAEGRRLEVIDLDILPYTEPVNGVRYPVPYTYDYLVNGGAVVPALGGREDEEGLKRLTEILPDREIATVPSMALAVGGGGVGCITQQQPAGAPLSGRGRCPLARLACSR
jgi:agmatine deiminase